MHRSCENFYPRFFRLFVTYHEIMAEKTFNELLLFSKLANENIKLVLIGKFILDGEVSRKSDARINSRKPWRPVNEACIFWWKCRTEVGSPQTLRLNHHKASIKYNSLMKILSFFSFSTEYKSDKPDKTGNWVKWRKNHERHGKSLITMHSSAAISWKWGIRQK